MSDLPETVFTSQRFFVLRHRWQSASGAPLVKETIQHPGSVVILPLLADGRICLIRNFRVAVGQTLLELPAGTLDQPGEDAANAAQRELAEETGYRAGRIQPLTEFLMSPGILNERMQLFLATELQPGDVALEPGEEIQNQLVAWPEALAMIADGRICDAKTMLGLLFYERFRAAQQEPARRI